jgi:hypothetical protein
MSEVPFVTADRGLGPAAPQWWTIVPDPTNEAMINGWFYDANELYRQGVQSRYTPAILAMWEGVLALAAIDADEIRRVSMVGGIRNMQRERTAADRRWADHEKSMRDLIRCSVADPGSVIENYFMRKASTLPEDYRSLKWQTVKVAFPDGSTMWQWQVESERSFETHAMVNAAVDTMPLASTIEGVRVAFDPPESDADWRATVRRIEILDAGIDIREHGVRTPASGTYRPPAARGSTRGATTASERAVHRPPPAPPANRASSPPPRPLAPSPAPEPLDERGTGVAGRASAARGLEVPVSRAPALERNRAVAANVADARAVFAPTLARRPVLSQQLDELEKTGSATKMDPAVAARIDNLRIRMAQLQEIDRVSQAPRNAQILEVSADKTAANYFMTIAFPLPRLPVVLEFPDGSRVWRDPTGATRHEATLGESVGRAGMERAKYTATQHGNLPAGPKYQRAHALGQGTGFESGYAIYYAPEYVNQTLQNRGIETYLRDLAANAAPGETFRVVTTSTPHKGTLRLATMEYSIVRVAGGQVEQVATYSLRVTGTKEHPLVTADPLRFSPTVAGQALAGRIPIPDVLTKPASFTY